MYDIVMASDGMTYIPSPMPIGSGIRVILRILFNTLRDCSVGITGEKDL
jgi:hypothetical protein